VVCVAAVLLDIVLLLPEARLDAGFIGSDAPFPAARLLGDCMGFLAIESTPFARYDVRFWKEHFMYVVAVTIFVKPQQVQPFIDATLDNARNTRREPGNVRFDVLQSEEDPTRFLLYEVYKTKDDHPKHQQTAHYLRWKSAVTDWMAQPRQGVKHNTIFFGDSAT
jgi:autoinducer 2-degrading protein